MKRKSEVLGILAIMLLAYTSTGMATPLMRDNVKGVIQSVSVETGIVSVREHETGLVYEIHVDGEDIVLAQEGLNASVNYYIGEDGTFVAEGATFFSGDGQELLDVQAVLNNEVMSRHIAEADNSSGQNTNTGSGVKTGHIANGAITPQKLRNGSVVTNKIRNLAVTTGKLRNNAVTTNKIRNGAVTSSKLQDGAVLAELLDDDGSGSGLDADMLDGLGSSAFAGAEHWHYSLNARDGSPTNSLYVDLDGDVGIGMTNPLYDLDVNGTVRVSEGIRLTGNGYLMDTGGTVRFSIADNNDTYVRDAGGLARIRIIDDGDTLFYDSSGSDRIVIDSATGYVGVGTASPSARLDVVGGVRINGGVGITGLYSYSQPKYYDYNVPGNEFTSVANYPVVAAWDGYWYRTNTAQYSYAKAALHMPADAEFVTFTCYGYDNDPGNNIIMTWQLLKRANFSTSVSVIATATYTSSGAPGVIQAASATAVSPEGVSNTNYTYWIVSTMQRVGSTTSSNLRDYGCRIGYRTSLVSP